MKWIKRPTIYYPVYIYRHGCKVVCVLGKRKRIFSLVFFLWKTWKDSTGIWVWVMMSKKYSIRLVKFGFSGDWCGPWTSCFLIIFVESVWNHNGKFGLCLTHPPPQTEKFPYSVCNIYFLKRIPTMYIVQTPSTAILSYC